MYYMNLLVGKKILYDLKIAFKVDIIGETKIIYNPVQQTTYPMNTCSLIKQALNNY